jgi:hypothetical protein
MITSNTSFKIKSFNINIKNKSNCVNTLLCAVGNFFSPKIKTNIQTKQKKM